MDSDESMTLIESALSDVRVLTCPQCEGEGKLPNALDITCPRCHGCGVTTDGGEANARE